MACSHNNEIDNSFDRWKEMMDKIDQNKNENALIIKLADLTDNMTYCHLLKPDRYDIFINKKAPYIMELMYKYLDYADFDLSNLKETFFDRWNEQKIDFLENKRLVENKLKPIFYYKDNVKWNLYIKRNDGDGNKEMFDVETWELIDASVEYDTWEEYKRIIEEGVEIDKLEYKRFRPKD